MTESKGLNSPEFYQGYVTGLIEALTALVTAIKTESYDELEEMHHDFPEVRITIEESVDKLGQNELAMELVKRRHLKEIL